MQVLSMHDPANGIVCLPNYVDHDQLRVFYKVLTLPALLVSTNTDAAGGAQAAYVFVHGLFASLVQKYKYLRCATHYRPPTLSCPPLTYTPLTRLFTPLTRLLHA
jgi:hypothetical protein